LKRNTIHFDYVACFPAEESKGPLKSTLTNFKDLSENKVREVVREEYKEVGRYGFKASLHPKTELPCIDFPSFHWIRNNGVQLDLKKTHHGVIERVLVVIPPSPEDQNEALMETYLRKLMGCFNQEVFINYPFQETAIPLEMDTPHTRFHLVEDQY